ncbi:iron dicitrate transport regulator FecR [Ruegeria sediminis]|uniref:Iron dicitrate transport regulator FecR n=2 Tax=Ruegeria sediminis TaxID=2583820 RepID=A0ABY2X4T1_9RHOB|nr:iron dicitrate transport regulator FecR [Ruegeria sediminis]
MAVNSGDAITTDGSGVVQIIFSDETKIAVGPNARMVLDVTMMRGNQAAKNFAVKALGGSFRFISGKSKKSAYSIETPTATMGVRGTIFDFWVLGQRQSSLVILEGTVRMCGQRGACSLVRGQCALVATSPRGQIGRPVDNTQAARALRAGFPFIMSQTVLSEPFRADVGGCASLMEPPTQFEEQIKQPIPEVTPPPAPTVAPAPAPAPPAPAPAPPAPAPAPAPSVGTSGGDGGGPGASGGQGGTGLGSGGGGPSGAGGDQGSTGGGVLGGGGGSQGGSSGGGGTTSSGQSGGSSGAGGGSRGGASGASGGSGGSGSGGSGGAGG